MRLITLLVVLWFSNVFLKAEMLIQTSQGKEFADLVESALVINDTDDPEIEAQTIAAQQRLAAMGSVADKRLIQMVSEWLTLSEQGEMGTIKGIVYPSVALAFVSHDPDASSLLGPLMEWMDRLAEGKLKDQGTFPQRVAMFIALWGGDSEMQRLKNDMDKLLASSAYGAHMTGLDIQRALDGQPSGPKRFAHLKSTISQWCQRQIDYRNSLKTKLLRSPTQQTDKTQASQQQMPTLPARPTPALPKSASTLSTSHHWWLWGAGSAAALVIVYITLKKFACR